MGFGAVEAMVVMEELGRGLVNAPYAQAALVAPTLLSAAPAGAAGRLAAEDRRRRGAGGAGAPGARRALPAEPRRPRSATRSRRRLDAHRHQDRRAGRRRGRCLHRAGAHRAARSTTPPASPVPGRQRGAGVHVRGYPTQDGARAADLVLADTPATLISRDGLARAGACGRRRHRRAVRRRRGPDGHAGRHHGRLHEHAQAVRRDDRQLPGAAPPHRRREDAARAGPLDELLRQPQARRAGRRSAAARCRRPRCSSGNSMRFVGQQCIADARRHRRHRRVHRQPLLQAPDGASR